MKKIIILIAVLLFLVTKPSNAFASEKHAGQSANMVALAQIASLPTDSRVTALKNIFKKYNSPLVENSAFYVKYADKYGVDWKLLPAISGLESSFGVHLMPGSYNGYGWGGGYIYFKSWEDGIETINKTLRANYMDKWGATDVWSIGPIYAESKTWSVRVARFMEEIEREYVKLSSTEKLVTI